MIDPKAHTIPRLLRSSAKRFVGRAAIVDGNRTHTFLELLGTVRLNARGLMAHGVGVGDRVALWAPNSSAWIVGALAVHDIGAVLVPINTRYKGEEAAEVLAKSGAVVLLTVTSFLDHDYVGSLERAKADLPQLRETIILRGDELPSGCVSAATLHFRGSKVTEAEEEARALAVQPDDVCGHPLHVGDDREAEGRHRDPWPDAPGLPRVERDGGSAPPETATSSVCRSFTSFGYKAGWLACLMTGATVYPHAVFDAERGARARVAEDEITVLPGPPTLYQSILAHPELDRYDLSSLRLAVTGAAGIPEELIYRMRESLALQDRAHGLRADRGDRRLHDVPGRRRCRDHRQDVGPRHRRAWRCAWPTTRAPSVRAASPGRCSSAATTS